MNALWDWDLHDIPEWLDTAHHDLSGTATDQATFQPSPVQSEPKYAACTPFCTKDFPLPGFATPTDSSASLPSELSSSSLNHLAGHYMLSPCPAPAASQLLVQQAQQQPVLQQPQPVAPQMLLLPQQHQQHEVLQRRRYVSVTKGSSMGSCYQPGVVDPPVAQPRAQSVAHNTAAVLAVDPALLSDAPPGALYGAPSATSSSSLLYRSSHLQPQAHLLQMLANAPVASVITLGRLAVRQQPPQLQHVPLYNMALRQQQQLSLRQQQKAQPIANKIRSMKEAGSAAAAARPRQVRAGSSDGGLFSVRGGGVIKKLNGQSAVTELCCWSKGRQGTVGSKRGNQQGDWGLPQLSSLLLCPADSNCYFDRQAVQQTLRQLGDGELLQLVACALAADPTGAKLGAPV